MVIDMVILTSPPPHPVQIKETRKAVHDSESGTRKVAVGHHIGKLISIRVVCKSTNCPEIYFIICSKLPPTHAYMFCMYIIIPSWIWLCRWSFTCDWEEAQYEDPRERGASRIGQPWWRLVVIFMSSYFDMTLYTIFSWCWELWSWVDRENCHIKYKVFM